MTRVLQEYMGEAQRTLEMLEDAQPGPSELTLRADVLKQRHRENNAHAQFQKARNLLLDLIRDGYQNGIQPADD